MTHTHPYASAPRGAAFPRTYPGAVLSVTDGDTLVMLLDRGGDDFWRVSVRLDGCNARELAAPGGVEARQHLVGLVAPVTPASVADLFDGQHTATVQSLRYAAAWNGTGSRPVPPWPIPQTGVA